MLCFCWSIFVGFSLQVIFEPPSFHTQLGARQNGEHLALVEKTQEMSFGEASKEGVFVCLELVLAWSCV